MPTDTKDSSTKQPDAIPFSDQNIPRQHDRTNRDYHNAKKQHQQRKPGLIARAVNHWCNRLLGAATDHSFSNQQEEYAAGQTRRDYVGNTLGIACWGMAFPLLSIIVVQLSGVEAAGMFTLAFVTASLLMIIGNYGVRTFQISDIDEEHSFSDYQINRLITCIIMMVMGVLWCYLRGYADQMLGISIGLYLCKMIDSLADVYEGRLQQMDKLYLAGISQAFRSIVSFVVFALFLLFTRNLVGACIAMAASAGAVFILFCLPLALFETPKTHRASTQSILNLFKQCFPVFIALFLYALIDNMPKFVMEGILSYDNQLYFNALYFPSQTILLITGLIYKPMLVRMTEAWTDPNRRRRFDLTIVAMLCIIVVLTFIAVGIMGSIGIPIMSFMYGLNFEQFRGLCFIMLAAGGVAAAIDFLYQVITVVRRQGAVTYLYLITFGFSLFVPILLIRFTGLPGTCIGYLIVMCILLVLLLSDYVNIRIEFFKEERDKKQSGEQSSAIKMRPSEIRAEHQRREQVHKKWEERAKASVTTKNTNTPTQM